MPTIIDKITQYVLNKEVNLNEDYLQAFQEQLAGRFDYVPHADPSKSGLKLEDHQYEALTEMYEGLLLNHKRMSAVASCGSGKTLVEIAAISASQAAKKLLGINGDRKDIVVTEGRTVVTGLRKQFTDLGIETGIWSGGKRELEPSIIIAGTHALETGKRTNTLKKNLPEGTIDLCVVDEVDRFLTKQRIALINLLNPHIVTGFTATEEWPDGRHISDAYGPVVHRIKLLEAMRQKINVVPEFFVYESEINESDLPLIGGDYDPKILQAAWKHAELHKSIPEIYKHIVPENLRKECPTLVYVPSKDMVHATVQSLQEQLGNSMMVIGLTGEDPTSVVEGAMQLFRDGDVEIIVLCEMGGRGMNLENARLLIDAYPTKSLNKLEQRHGRVLRKIRPGSDLWKKGWHKNDALIAQIIPKAGNFRPGLFTDIVGGYQELQRLRGEGGGGEGGAPISALITEARKRIEEGKPPLGLNLLARVDILHGIKKDPPLFGVDGVLKIPRRYLRPPNCNHE